MTVELIGTHQLFGGEQRKYRHFSEVLHSEMTFSLFLPQAKPEIPLSLVWWLSGLTCTDDNFSQKGAFQKYATENQLAFVIPDTSPRGSAIPDVDAWDLGQGASFYLNATQEPWKQNYQMYTYITEELTQIIFRLLPHLSGKESIMGHSMGGHGALMIGLKNPQRFTSISAFAPISNPSKTPWGKKAFSSYLGTDKKSWKSWDATELLAQSSVVPPIYITQGTADEFYGEQLVEHAFLSAAKTKQQQVTYQKAIGYDHSYFTIATFIEDHLKFHSKHLLH